MSTRSTEGNAQGKPGQPGARSAGAGRRCAARRRPALTGHGRSTVVITASARFPTDRVGFRADPMI
jgi:hypothetical protein